MWCPRSIMREILTAMCRVLPRRSETPGISNTSVIQYASIWELHSYSLLTPFQTLESSQQTTPQVNTRIQPMQNQPPSAFVGPSPAAQAPSLPTQNFISNSGPPSAFVSAPSPQNGLNGSPHNQTFSSMGAGGPPQLPSTQTSTPLYSQTPTGMSNVQSNNSNTSLPALRPVFGISLDDLLKRDGSAIPLVVYQCIQAVDLYGLEVEGVYRLSGSATHVSKLRSIFDNGE